MLFRTIRDTSTRPEADHKEVVLLWEETSDSSGCEQQKELQRESIILDIRKVAGSRGVRELATACIDRE